MMEHELSRHNISTNTSVVNSDDTTTTEAGVTQDTVTDNSPSKHFGTEYTLRQAKLNEELQVCIFVGIIAIDIVYFFRDKFTGATVLVFIFRKKASAAITPLDFFIHRI